MTYDGTNNLRARYTHGPGIDEPLAVQQGITNYFYHADGLGSIVALSNASGAAAQLYRYDAFGRTTQSGSVTQPYRYTAREYDGETGLYYYRARYYNPIIGRFITRDPIGFEGGDYNLFVYVGNNPVNKIDPMGLSGCGPGEEWGLGDLLIPDYPGYNFKPCCDQHDDCYGCEGKKAGKSKRDCDMQFCKCLIMTCLRSPGNPAHCPSLEYCLAVVMGGKKSFDNGRKCCN